MNLKNIANKASFLCVSVAALLVVTGARAGFVDERSEKEKAAAEAAVAASSPASAVAIAASAPAPVVAAAAPAASAVVAPVVVAAPPVKSWEVLASDVTLMKTFQRWAKEAGYTLRWDAEKNFVVSGPNTVVGDFERAVHDTLETPGIAFSDYPLEACVYPNKPLLMRVTRKGEQAAACPSVAIPVSTAGARGQTGQPPAAQSVSATAALAANN